MVLNTYEVQNIGDLLREKRKQLGKDIKEISANTKIRAEYLLALETGNYDKFASDVYAKGFLKKYAKFIGINPERAVAMYRREKKGSRSDILHDTDYLRQKINRPQFELTPGKIFTLIIGLILVGFVVYIISQIGTVLKEPELSLTAPIEASAGEDVTHTTTLEKISIRGTTEIGASLSLNGNQINTNELQVFEVKDIALELGENRFTIVSENQFGQQSQLLLIVYRENQPESAPTAGNNTNAGNTGNNASTNTNQNSQVLNIVLEIINSDAYVQTEIDGTPDFADFLTVGEEKDFTAQQTFSISTPRPESIKLTINGEEFVIQDTSEHVFVLNANGEVTRETL